MHCERGRRRGERGGGEEERGGLTRVGVMWLGEMCSITRANTYWLSAAVAASSSLRQECTAHISNNTCTSTCTYYLARSVNMCI